MLASSKFNSIEKIVFKALIDSDINIEEYALVINGAQSCFRLNENIITKNSQQGDIEQYRLIEHGKRIKIDKVIKQNERINNDLKSQV